MAAPRTPIPYEQLYKRRVRKNVDVDHYALIEDYVNGMSYSELSAKYSLSMRAVQRRVKSEEVVPRMSRSLNIMLRVKAKKFAREQQEIADYIARNPRNATEQPKTMSNRWT